LLRVCRDYDGSGRDIGAEYIKFEVFEFDNAMLRFVGHLGLKPSKRRYSKQVSDGCEAGSG